MDFDRVLFALYIFMLAAFLGVQVISKVPQLLHTPLMAFTNAISGVSLVASLVIAGADRGLVSSVLGTIAVFAATVNIVALREVWWVRVARRVARRTERMALAA